MKEIVPGVLRARVERPDTRPPFDNTQPDPIPQPHVVMVVDRNLKSGKFDFLALTPKRAVALAHDLLGAAMTVDN